MPTTPGKDTIYIDIDDEITTVIEKVRASNEKIVALVLPKRASVLQSIVNMKLLKRSADNAKKHVVLITSEAGLLPLAGVVGFHVAKNLQTKPEIPHTANTDDEDEVFDDTPVDGPEAEPDSEPEITADNAGDRPVGELAAAAGATAAADESIETLSMDDDGGSDEADADTPAAADDKSKAPKKNKKLAVPSFDKFRLRLLLGAVVLVLLIVLFYIATSVLPKATITLTTDTSDVNSNLTLNLNTSAKALNASTLSVPATLQTVQKSGSQQVATTGKKNLGTPASGNVTLTNCAQDGSEVDVPAGTGISAGGITYITQTTASMPNSAYFNTCKTNIPNSKATVKVVAQQPGNTTTADGTTMTVAGYAASITAKASGDINGGTDNIAQVVAQTDIDSATQKIAAQVADAIKSQLQTQLKQAGLYPITSTFVAGDPTTTASAKVGDQASTVTVTQATPYTMFGVKQTDLKTLVDADVTKHIDASKQSILTEGLDKATFHVNNATATTATIALTTTATAGPDLKADTIKSQVAGKKSGAIKSLLGADPGVTKVDVHYSPFWVNKAPSKPAKLTVIFQKAN
jgi:hypothetical protein